MRLPLDVVWPAAYRWLQLLHMEHLLEITGLRLMLLASCLISLTFGVSWVLDFAQLKCFEQAPWKQGLGQYDCLVKLVGGVVLLLMFRHSAVAMAYFDEDGDQLRQKKERYLDEMQKQVGHVLSRATGQAQKLCGLLSAELDEAVNNHVVLMQRILKECRKTVSPEAHAVHGNLARQMALHLHQLRRPAIEHFEKLIAMSGKTQFLEETLWKERHESMVGLLTEQGLGIPRTETAVDDPEVALLHQGAAFLSEAPSLCGCCQRRASYQPRPPRSTSVDRSFLLPTKNDLKEELLEVPPQDASRSPEKVVLRPVKLVLKWFEKIEPMRDIRSGRSVPLALGAAGQAADQLSLVWTHLKGSPFYRNVLFGMLASIFIFAFHFHMFTVVLGLIRDGSSSGLTMVSCFGELVRTVFVCCGMLCYLVSLGAVLWNVDRLDAVLQVSEEIHDLQDFKHQIDHLNAHDLSEEDSSVSMLQTVERSLAGQKRLVADFHNKTWGREVDIAEFQRLALDLQRALQAPGTVRAAEKGAE